MGNMYFTSSYYLQGFDECYNSYWCTAAEETEDGEEEVVFWGRGPLSCHPRPSIGGGRGLGLAYVHHVTTGGLHEDI